MPLIPLMTNQSDLVQIPSMDMGFSMDMGDVQIVRYVDIPAMSMGLNAEHGSVTQIISFESMILGAELSGEPNQLIPLSDMDIGISVNFGDVSSFDTRFAVIRYFCVLTGDADGTTDLTLPMKSFQARRRSGDPTYLSVVIPTVDYASGIAARPNGTIKVQQAYERNGEILQTETIIETNLDEVRPDEGSHNQSTTLTGYKTKTFTPKNISLSGVTYRTTNNGKYRYRIAKPYIFLNPGDTVTITDDGVELTVDSISYFIDATTSTIELEST